MCVCLCVYTVNIFNMTMPLAKLMYMCISIYKPLCKAYLYDYACVCVCVCVAAVINLWLYHSTNISLFPHKKGKPPCSTGFFFILSMVTSHGMLAKAHTHTHSHLQKDTHTHTDTD